MRLEWVWALVASASCAAGPELRATSAGRLDLCDLDGRDGADLVVPVPGRRAFALLTARSGALELVRTFPDADAAAAIDIDRDGRCDLAIGYPRADPDGRGLVALHAGGRDGLSERPDVELRERYAAAGLGAQVLAVGDMDGDGFPELAVLSGGWTPAGSAAAPARTTARLFLARSSPGKGISLAPVAWARASYRSITSGDVNGDGLVDLLATAEGPQGRDELHLFLGRRGAGLGRPDAVIEPGVAGAGWHPVGVGDLDGDRFGDVLVVAASGRALVYPGTRTGLAHRPSLRIEDADEDRLDFARRAVGGDFNGDGFADVAISAPRQARVALHLGGPQGLAATPTTTLSGPPGLGQFLAAADLDGDGTSDLVALAGAGGSASAIAYLGSRVGVIARPWATLALD